MSYVQALKPDDHMQAAIRLSDELREAYLCAHYVESRAARPVVKGQAARRAGLASKGKVQGAIKQPELIELGLIESHGSKPVAHAICEHLLASLRGQVAVEASTNRSAQPHLKLTNKVKVKAKAGVRSVQLSLL